MNAMIIAVILLATVSVNMSRHFLLLTLKQTAQKEAMPSLAVEHNVVASAGHVPAFDSPLNSFEAIRNCYGAEVLPEPCRLVLVKVHSARHPEFTREFRVCNLGLRTSRS